MEKNTANCNRNNTHKKRTSDEGEKIARRSRGLEEPHLALCPPPFLFYFYAHAAVFCLCKKLRGIGATYVPKHFMVWQLNSPGWPPSAICSWTSPLFSAVALPCSSSSSITMRVPISIHLLFAGVRVLVFVFPVPSPFAPALTCKFSQINH